MPTALGPLSLSAALNFSAMMSKACSQLTGVISVSMTSHYIEDAADLAVEMPS
jgi:hypothetical protein